MKTRNPFPLYMELYALQANADGGQGLPFVKEICTCLCTNKVKEAQYIIQCHQDVLPKYAEINNWLSANGLTEDSK